MFDKPIMATRVRQLQIYRNMMERNAFAQQFAGHYSTPLGLSEPTQRASVSLSLTLSQSVWVQMGDIFPLCGEDEVTSLFYTGQEPFLEWLEIRRAEAVRLEQSFISYLAPSGYMVGTIQEGLPTDLCDVGPGYEWATCDFVLEGFGRVNTSGPVRENGGHSLPLCKTQPRYTVMGQQITSERDWDMSLMVNVLMQRLAIRVLKGNKSASAMDAEGLERLIKTGYTNKDGTLCPLMDSRIIDWKGHRVCGDASADWTENPEINGVEVDVTIDERWTNLYYFLRETYHENNERLRLAGKPQLAYGDMAIVGPAHAFQSLIDCAVCFVECANDYTRMDTAEAIRRREDFMRGNGEFKEIEFDGFRVPLIPFNPLAGGTTGQVPLGQLDNRADGTVDLYMLIRGVGSERFMTLEYNPLDDGTLLTTDNGQFQIWENQINTCYQMHMRTQWRLFLNAPWAQTKIENVKVSSIYAPTRNFPAFVASAPAWLRTR